MGHFESFTSIQFEYRKTGRILIDYFPIAHNAFCLPPKFCINYCREMLLGGLDMLLGGLDIPKSISQQ